MTQNKDWDTGEKSWANRENKARCRTQKSSFHHTIPYIIKEKYRERELKYVALWFFLVFFFFLLLLLWKFCTPRRNKVCFHRLPLHFHDVVCLKKSGPSIFMTADVRYFYLPHGSQIHSKKADPSIFLYYLFPPSFVLLVSTVSFKVYWKELELLDHTTFTYSLSWHFIIVLILHTSCVLKLCIWADLKKKVAHLSFLMKFRYLYVYIYINHLYPLHFK
jgi:hypothetical protein